MTDSQGRFSSRYRAVTRDDWIVVSHPESRYLAWAQTKANIGVL